MTAKKNTGSEMDASGAIIAAEDKNVDMSHPSVDANPRQNKNLPPEANTIDFNMPSALQPANEQVEEEMKAQK